MKPGNIILKIIPWIFFTSAVAYFLLYFSGAIFSNYTTDVLYDCSTEDVLSLNGYIIRDEILLDGVSDLQEIKVAEGETVAVGDTIAVNYDDEAAFERNNTLETLQDKLDSLQYILSHSLDASDNAELNNSIITNIIQLSTQTANGNLSELSDSINNLKNLMLRRDYTYNGNQTITDEIYALHDQIEQLTDANKNYTSVVKSNISGTFSSKVDGFEKISISDILNDITPQKFEALLADCTPDGNYIGKIITGSSWYYVAILDADTADPLSISNTYNVRVNGLDNAISMSLVALSKPNENNQLCAVFKTDKYLAQTTMLRQINADVVLASYSGFRVPKSAVHVINDTGEVGIYRVYGILAKWVSVDIVYQFDDYYIVQQHQQYDDDNNPIPQTSEENALSLRAGVEIITSGKNIRDGKKLSR